jgi:hypothetical protein
LAEIKDTLEMKPEEYFMYFEEFFFFADSLSAVALAKEDESG